MADFTCTTKHKFNTGFTDYPSRPRARFSIISNNTAAVCGSQDNRPALKIFDLDKRGEVLHHELLRGPHYPDGISEVTLNKERVIALSYSNWDEAQINFFNVDDKKMISPPATKAPGPRRGLGRLWRLSPATLLCEKTSSPSLKVLKFDCNDSNPGSIGTFVEKGNDMLDMCFCQDGDRELVVMVLCDGGMKAGEIKGGKISKYVWESPKSVKGICIATDNRGHLFVWDANTQNIKVFNASDGRDLGTLTHPKGRTKWEEQEDLGVPIKMKWFENRSYLVVLLQKRESDKYLYDIGLFSVN